MEHGTENCPEKSRGMRLSFGFDEKISATESVAMSEA
jgi:hypothetical protein